MDKITFENRATQLRPQLIKIGVAFFGNIDDAEDVAQETLLKLFVIWDKLSEKDNLNALARKIANNYCISQKRRREKSSPIADDPTSSDDITVKLEMQESLTLVQKAVSHLTKGERRVWRMWQDGGMDIKQIAVTANIDTRTVSSVLSRSRKKILEELKRTDKR